MNKIGGNKMDIAEKQRQRELNDRKTNLINDLYRLGVTHTSDGREIERVSLFTLEHTHTNAKFRHALLLGKDGEW